MKNFPPVFLFPLVIVPLVFSCAKDQTPEDESPVPVRMAAVTERETAEEVRGFGSLSFLKKFELAAPAPGILERLYFREGDKIGKGDITGILKNPQISLAARQAEDAYSRSLSALDLALARLRDGEFQIESRLLENEKSVDELVQAEKTLGEERRKNLNREALYAAGGLSDEAIREERFRLEAAENQFLLMKKELEIRRVGLREEDLISAGIPVPEEREELRRALIHTASAALRAEAEASRANLEAASREMESARLMEAELIIKSPGDGIVGARFAEEGEHIKSGDRLLTIMDTASLYAIFPVPEREAPKLKKGMTAQVTSGGEKIYGGKVDLISPQADNQSFTFLVRILLAPGSGASPEGNPEDNPLKPGMFAQVVIPLEAPRKITVIPEAALASKKGNNGIVFTVHNNILSERKVVLGSLIGDEREIVSGLVPGEVAALGKNPALKEGAYVSKVE